VITNVSSQTLEDVISSLLAKENITIVVDTEGHTKPETTLYPMYNCSKSTKEKGDMECHY
jgi:hypothetical protein